jgi:hypothetical protein
LKFAWGGYYIYPPPSPTSPPTPVCIYEFWKKKFEKPKNGPTTNLNEI